VLAQQITDRVVELVVNALDVNDLIARVDLNAVLGADMAALVEETDLGAVIARSSGRAWDARAARLRFLARQAELPASGSAPPGLAVPPRA